MANRKPNHLLVLAAAMCGPHQSYQDALTALRTHPNPKIKKLATGCTRKALENRLRRYQKEMLRPMLPGIEFWDPAALTIMRFAYMVAPYLPDDDPGIFEALADVCRVVADMNEAAPV
jgi:hypothetical protein